MARDHAVRCNLIRISCGWLMCVSFIRTPFLSRLTVVIKIRIFSHFFSIAQRQLFMCNKCLRLIVSVCELLDSIVRFYNSRVRAVGRHFRSSQCCCTVLQSTTEHVHHGNCVPNTRSSAQICSTRYVVFPVVLTVNIHYCCKQLSLICLYN